MSVGIVKIPDRLYRENTAPFSKYPLSSRIGADMALKLGVKIQDLTERKI
jgi:hypothetical protein